MISINGNPMEDADVIVLLQEKDALVCELSALLSAMFDDLSGQGLDMSAYIGQANAIVQRHQRG